MSSRSELVENATAFGLALTGILAGSASIATAAIPAAMLTSLGLERWASTDASVLRAAKREAEDAIQQNPDIPDFAIEAAAHLLKNHHGRLVLDPERMTKVAASGNAATEITKSVFGGLTGRRRQHSPGPRDHYGRGVQRVSQTPKLH